VSIIKKPFLGWHTGGGFFLVTLPPPPPFSLLPKAQNLTLIYSLSPSLLTFETFGKKFAKTKKVLLWSMRRKSQQKILKGFKIACDEVTIFYKKKFVNKGERRWFFGRC
jgi:hypothetical protein